MTFKGSDDSFGKLYKKIIFHGFLIFCDYIDNTFATQINRIVSHPTMPILVSGHEDRHIKFFDLKSGNQKKRWRSTTRKN
jgi:hypothetical protein